VRSELVLFFLWNVLATGRQLPPLSSVLYGIISERRTVLAAKLLLKEKSGAWRVDTDSNIPSFPAGSMIFIWWKLKMSYCLSQLGFSSCFYIPSSVHQQLLSLDYQNFVDTTL
jgi:hypothetical protein